MNREKFKIGELRPSQLMHSFGVGSIVDFPNFSGIIMGFEDWQVGELRAQVYERRLREAVHARLGPRIKNIYKVPVPVSENPFSREENSKGVPVEVFPRWLRCPVCGRMAQAHDHVVEFQSDFYSPDRMKFRHAQCTKASGGRPTMIPVRRLVACEFGHIDDVDWVYFVHQGESDCKGPLYWKDYGVTGAAEETEIECKTCGKKQKLIAAFGDSDGGKRKSAIPEQCNGHHPHLRHTDTGCKGQPRTIVLGASNSWFSMTVSVIAIPVEGSELDGLVADHWTNLNGVINVATIPAFRQGGLLPGFEKFSDDQIFAAIERYRSGAGASPGGAGSANASSDSTDLKLPEWQTFTKSRERVEDRSLSFRSMPIPDDFKADISRIVRVDRLREAQALIGFTRLLSPGEFGEWDDDVNEMRVPLARSKDHSWLIGNENKGEGIFIQFNENRVKAWCEQSAIQQRSADFLRAHAEFRSRRNLEPNDALFPGMRYILLHSFSHAFMRQLALSAGYSHAAIRERIYSRAPGDPGGPMAGVLIYTSAPDSEGTLGGLASMANSPRLDSILAKTLESMQFCSSDPHCAEKAPDSDGMTLHAAACHACLFSPETSCENGNKYLDRGLLMPTLSGENLAFFNQG